MGIIEEIYWANVFHDTIRGSLWLREDISFSPGRWAIGYPALYALYRTLDEFEPKSILELGLGQSTKMIHSYFENSGITCRHDLVEDDLEWISFFKKKNDLEGTNIINLNVLNVETECPAMGISQTDINIYENFKTEFEGKKYQMIFIDAPKATEGELSRIDMLSILPECLEEDFVIFMDDYNRIPEQRTVQMMITALKNAGVEYCVGIYSGEKDTILITNPKNKFLCSM